MAPGYIKQAMTYQRIDEFDPIVVGWVMASSDHDANCSIALLSTKARGHANGEHDMIKPVSARRQVLNSSICRR